MVPGREGGQAAVETVGVVVALALALAALAVWMQGALRPPERPPEVIAHVSRPLGFPDNIPYWRMPAVPYGQEGRDEPVGDVLRGLGRGARRVAGAWLTGRREFSTAYNRRLRERLDDVLRDPLGAPALPDLDVLTPEGLARRGLDRGGELIDYVRRLRRMPRDRLTRTVLRDAGEFMADATIEVLQALARRRAAQGGRPAPPPPPAPGEGRRP